MSLCAFAWCDWQHGEIERSDALHGKDVEGADGDAILLAGATVAVMIGSIVAASGWHWLGRIAIKI